MRAVFRCPSSCRVLLCTQSRPVSCLPARPLGSLGLNPYLVVDLAVT
uniref:Uncharacterized protein n=1 Tax=Zea mays TaxID=4577 RepID=B6TSF6_MAIZE|nr:hypothetical protein [Zea mays]